MEGFSPLFYPMDLRINVHQFVHEESFSDFRLHVFLCSIHFANADEPKVYSCKVASNHTDRNFTGLPEPGDELLLIITANGALIRENMSGFSLIFDDIFESKFMMYRAASIEDTQVQSLHFNQRLLFPAPFPA